MSRPRLRRLVLCAVVCAVALGIFVLEAQIPLPLPFPGIKLGLSNIVTLLALALLGWKEALGIVLGRVLLGNLLLGQPSALLYALSGGLLSWLCMALLSRALPKNQLWVCGVCGGIAHICAQMLVALAVTQTPLLLWYLPLMLLCALATGLLTGTAAQLAYDRIIKNRRNSST